eukprot:scaffold133085_cov29-Tisochrysis_lutea.AAC.1
MGLCPRRPGHQQNPVVSSHSPAQCEASHSPSFGPLHGLSQPCTHSGQSEGCTPRDCGTHARTVGAVVGRLSPPTAASHPAPPQGCSALSESTHTRADRGRGRNEPVTAPPARGRR